MREDFYFNSILIPPLNTIRLCQLLDFDFHHLSPGATLSDVITCTYFQVRCCHKAWKSIIFSFLNLACSFAVLHENNVIVEKIKKMHGLVIDSRFNTRCSRIVEKDGLASEHILSCKQTNETTNVTTNDKLFEHTQAVCQAQRLSMRVGAIFLDIEKAFNSLAQWFTLRTVTYERTRFVAQLSKG